jgi:hypothetical protein
VSLIDSQEEIKTALAGIPNVGLFEDQNADEVEVEIVPGTDMIRPFITVSFGGRQEAPGRMRGIVGAKADANETAFVIQTVASNKITANKLLERVWDVLIGYVPTNCGEIRAALYGGTGKVSSLGNPTRFAAMQSFRYVQNSDTIQP